MTKNCGLEYGAYLGPHEQSLAEVRDLTLGSTQERERRTESKEQASRKKRNTQVNSKVMQSKQGRIEGEDPE